jgi:hypothetical protein
MKVCRWFGGYALARVDPLRVCGRGQPRPSMTSDRRTLGFHPSRRSGGVAMMGRWLRITVVAGCGLAVSPLLIIGCGGAAQTSPYPVDGSSPSSQSDGGQSHASVDAAVLDATVRSGCMLPTAPADICSALPTGKVTPCSQDGGQPSQTGYLEIDSPDSSPIYVCATSWSSDPSIGYIFGQPATFLSQAQSCCGGTVSAAAAPTVPPSALGSLGTPHVPSHIKPQEMEQPGGGTMRQDPFAVVVTDTNSGAAAIQAMSTWVSWAGDGKLHPAPDGTGAYYFAAGFPINYVILETSGGFPVIVIAPEVSLTADGTTPIGHPTLGVCPAGGGAPLAMIAGEIHGTTINNHSGRYDYGPWATAEALNNLAKVFNCMGIQITDTKYYAPKS